VGSEKHLCLAARCPSPPPPQRILEGGIRVTVYLQNSNGINEQKRNFAQNRPRHLGSALVGVHTMSSRLQLQEHRGLLAVAAQRDREDVAGLVVANNLLGESRNGIHLTNSTKSRAMGGGKSQKNKVLKNALETIWKHSIWRRVSFRECAEFWVHEKENTYPKAVDNGDRVEYRPGGKLLANTVPQPPLRFCPRRT